MDSRTPCSIVSSLRRAFSDGRTRSLAWRLDQLSALEELIRVREVDLVEALRADLGKCAFEAWGTELGLARAEARFARRHVKRWLRPQRVSTPLVNWPGSSWVEREPLGVVLIIGPWNYPVNLVLAPLVGAIAAGNCAVIKPSESAPNVSKALARWLPEHLDRECIVVVEGGPEAVRDLLVERWDHVFYTGGAAGARFVMEAAAKHLTPVTLELGGKSPCIVDGDVDLRVAARRIAWGKFMNAGQTCVAPDYLLVHEAVEEPFLRELKSAAGAFYGADPRKSGDYGRIINARHHARLAAFLRDGDVVMGGGADAGSLYIAPTVLRNVPADAPCMQEEIFGPVLPVLRVRSLDDAIAFVNERPKPLAVYLFSRSADAARRVAAATSSGATAVNDVAVHLAVPGLPFGGVGPSGMGAYHGRHSFETFSHRKSIHERAFAFDLSLRYPPYDGRKLKWLRRLL